MGLCKCPKRRVTNQFCFEHRVNVCEHCMVTNHPKCIIQSYLQWLQDSDYNAICELCSSDLTQDDCIRLTCYHVYHWACLDRFLRQLPSTTAPAGYTCPSCKAPLFPPSNLVSPVADVLREKLAGVNWARAGLGLPLLSEDRELKPTAINHVKEAPVTQSLSPQPSHSVVHVDEGTFSRTDNFQVPARRLYQDVNDSKGVIIDHDEDKYKRRPASEWIKRWWKNMSGLQPRSRNSSGTIYRRYCMAAILIVLALIVLVILFSRLGRIVTENDPSLELHNNPNIRVENNPQHSM